MTTAEPVRPWLAWTEKYSNGEEIRAAIKRLVDSAPPLSAEQKARIRAVLMPSVEHQRRSA